MMAPGGFQAIVPARDEEFAIGPPDLPQMMISGPSGKGGAATRRPYPTGPLARRLPSAASAGHTYSSPASPCCRSTVRYPLARELSHRRNDLDGSDLVAETRRWLRSDGNGSYSLAQDNRSTCRFSPLMSSGAALTWTAAGLLIDLSSPALLPECRFPRQLTGDSHCDVATAAIQA